ncbi:unnamed protein product [Symbiodinium natans]|uniref:Ubiquitin-like domain-containing protein n=1 Tax=Symbiodinium natans TaxID=878477 RepID=A0A812R3F7_9DINO|nr:unnamed protein product [Symbiodinium natans]
MAEPQAVSWAYTIPIDSLSESFLQDVCKNAQPENTTLAILLDAGGGSEPVEMGRWLFQAIGCRRLLQVHLKDFQEAYPFLATASRLGLPSYPLEILEGKLFVAGRVTPDETAVDQLGITHVADLRCWKSRSAMGSCSEYRHFPIQRKEHLKPTLTQVLPFVCGAFEAGGRVMLHAELEDVSMCHAVASIAAFLMQDCQLDLPAALATVRKQLAGEHLDDDMCQQLRNRCWTFGSIHLEVLALSGTHMCTLDAEPFLSVQEVQSEVEKLTGIRPYMQRLLLGEGELDQDRWRAVVQDFHASDPDEKYRVTLHLVQCKGDVWDALRDLLEVLVHKYANGRHLDLVLAKFESVKEEMQNDVQEAAFIPMPGMYGGVSVAWLGEWGKEALEIRTSSRMDENWSDVYHVSSDGFKKMA